MQVTGEIVFFEVIYIYNLKIFAWLITLVPFLWHDVKFAFFLGEVVFHERPFYIQPITQNSYCHQDLSFKQATLVALADAPNTRWISVEQAGERSGRERFHQAVEEDNAAVIAEISLARRMQPILLAGFFFCGIPILH